jgi:hypothetical protein
MYLATTDSFATGARTALSIDHSGTIQTTRSYLQAVGSLRAPIFYDSDNTGYYLDPAGTSRIGIVNFDGGTKIDGAGDVYARRLSGSTGVYYFADGGAKYLYWDGSSYIFGPAGPVSISTYIQAPIYYDSTNTTYYIRPASTDTGLLRGWLRFNDYGAGIVGLYDSTRFQQVFAMGDAYKGNITGTSLSGAYGLWWSYPSAGGPAANLTSHGLMCIVNGAFYASLDASMRAISDMRAPLFYDYNDTSYYVNPNGTSQLSYVLANNYFRAQGSTGLYLQDYAYYFDRNPDTYGNFRCGVNPQNSYVGICFNYSSARPTVMFDSGGNGGLYNYTYWIYYWLVGNACLGVRTSTTSSSYAMYVDGGIYSTGNVVAYSDVRKKTNIVTVDNAVDTVLKLRGVYYNRIETNDEKVDPNKRQIGVIAQEINEVLPEVVTYAKDVDEYGVQYGNMAGLFIEAIKELKAEIEELKRKLH